MPPKEGKIQLNPLTVGGVIVGAVVVILLVVSLMQIFRKNPYGPETRIDNIEIVDKKLPQDQKDQLFSQLYGILVDNISDGEPPESRALVREGTVDYGYDEDLKIYAGNFIVDVPAVEQSYKVQLSWSPEKNNPNLGGYPILITCAPKDLRIYASQTGCVNVLTMELSWNNAYQLDYTFGATTSQKIRGVLGKVIVDEDEGPEEFAATVDETSLKKLRDQPDVTYQYNVVFGGETFKITTRVDETYGSEYIIIYVDSAAKKQGIIMTDKEDRLEEFSAWLRSLSGKADLSIMTEKLN